MPIRWMIQLTAEGELRGLIPMGGNEKGNKRGLHRVVPQVGRTRNDKANLLADKGEYVLGIAGEAAHAERARTRRELFVDLTKRCSEATKDPSVAAIVKFLDTWNPVANIEILPDNFDVGDNLTFDVDGTIPAIESSAVQVFWAKENANENAPLLNCLITGEIQPVEKVLPSTAKIKSLGKIGGKSSGASLVSADKQPFQSYGLKNSLTSPISRDAAERFGKALNHLLSDRDSHIYIGGTLAYTWWSKEESGFSLRLVSEPEDDPQSVYRLMDSARSGKQRTGSEAEKFYALALSASGGRAVVRDWLETTIPEAEVNLGRWFRAQEIVDAYGKPMQPLGVFRLAAAAYRDATKEMQPTIPAAMIRTALSGGRLPDDLLARAVRRNIVGTKYSNSETTDHVPRERAALMKAIFTTQGRIGMDEMKSLETAPNLEGVDKAAYSCGRLLAELEYIQRRSEKGKINTTIVDRYYAAASTTPGKVFGLLIANSQNHLSKIRKSSNATYEALNQKIEEIVAPPMDFPNSLDVGQQGLFALGYYHQRAENRAAAIAAIAASETKKNSETRNNDGEEN